MGSEHVGVLDKQKNLFVLHPTGETRHLWEKFMPPGCYRHHEEGPVVVCSLPGGGLRVGHIDTGAIVDIAAYQGLVQAEQVAVSYPFAATTHGTRVVVWNVEAGSVEGSWESADAVTAVDVHPEGTLLVGDCAGRVTLVRNARDQRTNVA
jgi:hypothetical protein